MVIFELSMPNAGSWDGKWSSAGSVHAIAKTNAEVPRELIGHNFHHTFSDGWSASISVKKMSNNDAKKILSKSVGFAGYGWMVDSIIKNGEILAD